MAYPPAVPPSSRTDTTPQFTNHPSDHNKISDALTDIINELGTNPSGTAANLTSRLSAYRRFAIFDTPVTQTALTTSAANITAGIALPPGTGYYVAMMVLTIDPTTETDVAIACDILGTPGAVQVALGYTEVDAPNFNQVFCLDAASYNTTSGIDTLTGRCRRGAGSGTARVMSTAYGSHLVVATWTDV